jgi:hydantoinase/carbamoylase family amidase
MAYRRDALCGAAEVLLAVEQAAKARTDPPVVGTVGYLDYDPRSVVIIPGRVQMIIDVRSIDTAARDAVRDEIEAAARQIAARRKLDLEWRLAWTFPPTQLDPEIIKTLTQACEELRVPYQRIASGAGHDAMTLGRRFPAGMLFVPSVGGISHAPEEFTRIEDLEAGAKVLCRSLCALAAG